MTGALWLILKAIGSLLATACVLRAYAWRVHLSPRNPVSQFVVAITDWLVRPIQKILPPSRNADWASMLAGLLIAILVAIAFSLIYMHGRTPAFGSVVLIAVIWLVEWSLYLLMALVILQAVLSWVNPYAPLAPAVNQLTAPFLRPVQRVIPPIGGVDLSPLVLILLVQVALYLLETLMMQLPSLPL